MILIEDFKSRHMSFTCNVTVKLVPWMILTVSSLTTVLDIHMSPTFSYPYIRLLLQREKTDRFVTVKGFRFINWNSTYLLLQLAS